MTRGAPAGRWLVVTGLRRWAYGSPTDEAAVELLVGMGSRFTSPGCPWVRPCPRRGWFWLDANELGRFAGRMSVEQARLVALVVTLLSGEPAAVPCTASQVELGRAAA